MHLLELPAELLRKIFAETDYSAAMFAASKFLRNKLAALYFAQIYVYVDRIDYFQRKYDIIVENIIFGEEYAKFRNKQNIKRIKTLYNHVIVLDAYPNLIELYCQKVKCKDAKKIKLEKLTANELIGHNIAAAQSLTYFQLINGSHIIDKIPRLGENIQTLILRTFVIDSIVTLPPRLKYLNVGFAKNALPIELPPSIEELHIDGGERVEFATNHPLPNLKFVEIYNPWDHVNIINLPQEITKLKLVKIDAFEIENVISLPNLKIIDIYREQLFDCLDMIIAPNLKAINLFSYDNIHLRSIIIPPGKTFGDIFSQNYIGGDL